MTDATGPRTTASGIEMQARLRPRRRSAPERAWVRRGPSPSPAASTDMYRGRLWTMRQYAGFGTAEEIERALQIPARAGQTGLCVAFDLPDADGLRLRPPARQGEVGRVGVAIDSLDDMRTLFDGLPLDKVSTSMTINATAAILLLLYELVAEEQGVAPASAARHDPERHPQGVHRPRDVHLPAAAVHAAGRPTSFAYCARARCRSWNTISISGYHIREAGLDGRAGGRLHAGRRHRLRRGGRSTPGSTSTSSRRGSRFFFNAHNNLFEEVAKFRAGAAAVGADHDRALRRARRASP